MLENQTSLPSPQELSLQAELFGTHKFAARFVPLRALNELYRKSANPGNHGFCKRLLAEMRIDCMVAPADLEKIPKTGPVVIVANHPFGLLDGLILAAYVPQVRRDVKIIANHVMSKVPELNELCIFVDPFGRSAFSNRKPLKDALHWLKQGGLVVVFPAGEVSHWHAGHRRIEDPAWSDTASRLIQLSGATVVPAFFHGRNSASFHALGLIHPVLRTARLVHEFLNARGRNVEFRIGNPIPSTALGNLSSTQATEYVRWRTYLLANRRAPHSHQPRPLFSLAIGKAETPLLAPVPPATLAAEVASLPASARLSEDRELTVFAAKAGEIPNLLLELGRLRELTFRKVGEGTGKASDLDQFDRTYRHLFIWNKLKREIVGSYRMGWVRELMAASGPAGLYTNTLFQFDIRLFDHVGDALELGRSFIRPEYQRQYAPLLLLWKAIGQFVSAAPKHAMLFGAVSISSAYKHISRELLVNFYGSRLRSPLAEYVRPRRSFRRRMLHDWEMRQIESALDTADSLAEVIADVENDGKEIPILLKQYAKLGGELLGFNVDTGFSNVVDGLMLIDLRKTNPRILERYLGKAGARSFLDWHGIVSPNAESTNPLSRSGPLA